MGNRLRSSVRTLSAANVGLGSERGLRSSALERTLRTSLWSQKPSSALGAVPAMDQHGPVRPSPANSHSPAFGANGAFSSALALPAEAFLMWPWPLSRRLKVL